jgi:hypothetical protein
MSTICFRLCEGEWYGPSTAAHVLKDLARMHHHLFRGPLEVYVAQDGIIYKSSVEEIAVGEEATKTSAGPPMKDENGSTYPSFTVLIM